MFPQILTFNLWSYDNYDDDDDNDDDDDDDDDAVPDGYCTGNKLWMDQRKVTDRLTSSATHFGTFSAEASMSWGGGEAETARRTTMNAEPRVTNAHRHTHTRTHESIDLPTSGKVLAVAVTFAFQRLQLRREIDQN